MPDPAAFMPAGATDPEADEFLELADAVGAEEGREPMESGAADPPRPDERPPA